MKNKKGGILEFILFITGMLLILNTNNFLGTILAIISLIISIVKIKNKNILTVISLIGSSMMVIYSIIAFLISFNTINDIVSDAKYKNFESTLEYEAQKYIDSYPSNDENLKITIEDLEKNGMPHYDNGCIGYVMYSRKDNTYKAYIKCDNYETKYSKDEKLTLDEDDYENIKELERVFASDVVYHAELGRIKTPKNDEIIYVTKEEFEKFLNEYNSNLSSSSMYFDSPFDLSAKYECDGYVSLKVDNTLDNKYIGTAYVKCKDNYQTDGFDNNILK